MAKRRKRSTAAPVRRRRHAPAKTSRRRRRASGGLSASGIMGQFKPLLSASAGGVGYAVLAPAVSEGWGRFAAGLAGSFVLGYMGMPLVGAGMAGAAAADIAKSQFGLSDDFMEADYSDADLSDDDVMEDDNGDLYAMSDDGESLVYLGNSYDLSANGYDLSDGEQSVMMVPDYAN